MTHDMYPDTPCDIAPGSPNAYGYIYYQRSNIRHPAHGWAWLDAGRHIPLDHVLHHLCEVKACRQLDHLQLLSRSDHTSHHNTHREIQAA